MMKKTLWATALLAAVLALPGAARAHGYGRVEAGQRLPAIHAQHRRPATGAVVPVLAARGPLPAGRPHRLSLLSPDLALPPNFGAAPGGGLPVGARSTGPRDTECRATRPPRPDPRPDDPDEAGLLPAGRLLPAAGPLVLVRPLTVISDQ